MSIYASFAWNWTAWPYVYKINAFPIHAIKWPQPSNGSFCAPRTRHPKNVLQLITRVTREYYSQSIDFLFVWCMCVFYCRLDGAACLLNSNKYFPSRVSIKESSVLKLGSVCRRVYRIFSHAYFHHRRIFNEFEEETSLCLRFTHFVTKYNLMSKENLIVPIPDCETITGESEA